MPQFKNFDPEKYVLVFKSRQIQGWADGTFIKISRNANTFTTRVGAGGDVTRVRSRNKTGQFEVTLLAECDSNTWLQTCHDLDEETGLGYGAILFKDLNGTTVAEADIGWVEKPADMEGAAEGADRTWIIAVAQLRLANGQSLV